MQSSTQRKVERLYRPGSVKLTIGERTFTVHNLSVGGIGFLSEDPLPFKMNERLMMTVDLEGRAVEMAGQVMHLSPMSEIRSNLAPDKECYLCGISFETCQKEAGEEISAFVSSRLPEQTAGR